MSRNLRTLVGLELMTVKGYTENGYKLGRVEYNDADYFIAPWYSAVEGFYSRLVIGQKVLTKKVVNSTNLCHIVALIRNTSEDESIDSGKENERIRNTIVNPLHDEVKIFKRGTGSLRFRDKNISLLTPNKQGIKLIGVPNSIETNISMLSDGTFIFDSGRESITGKAYVSKSRNPSSLRLSSENLGNVDDSFFKRLRPLGLFPRSRAAETIYKQNLPRNYNRVSFKHLPEMFYGFDSYANSFIREVLGERSNYYLELVGNPFFKHFFLPNESMFFISGGLFSKEGYEYDINFNSLKYGNFGKIPSSPRDILKTSFLFKRGQSFYFSSNSSVFNESDIKSDNIKNLNIISDRDGFTKINLPKSSFFGNLPISSSTSIEGSKLLNINVEERNPLVNLSASGDHIPKTNDETRISGVRYSGVSKYNYSSENSYFRAKPTKYHNMLAAAEQLLSNYPRNIVVSTGGGKVTNEKFERWFSRSEYSDSSSKTGSPMLQGDSEAKASGSSYIIVSPSSPAIYSGGSDKSMFVAGQNIADTAPLSNDFEIKNNDAVKTEGKKSSGGYSLMLESAGAIISSIGKNDADGVSAMIDTEGSIVSWIGKDDNGRSIVTQTDGSINICVGGPELNKNSEETFHEGRFELRVNMVDKGFVGDNADASEKVKSSDYIISISNKGLVISGGKQNAPILISSNGDLNLESQNGNVNLISNKGKVRYKRGPGDFSEIGYRDIEGTATGDLLNEFLKSFGD